MIIKFGHTFITIYYPFYIQRQLSNFVFIDFTYSHSIYKGLIIKSDDSFHKYVG